MSLKRKLYLEEKNATEKVNNLLEQLRQQEPYKTRKRLIEQLKQFESAKKVESQLQKLREEKKADEERKYKDISDIYSESSGSYPPSSIANRYQNMSSNELFQEMKKGVKSHNDYDKAIRKKIVRSPQGNTRGSPTRQNMSAYELSNTIKEKLPDIQIKYLPNYNRITTPNPVYKGGTRKRKTKRKKYTKRGKANKKKSTRKK